MSDRSSSPVLKGELVRESDRMEPVCMRSSGGLVHVSDRSSSPVLKGELVNKD